MRTKVAFLISIFFILILGAEFLKYNESEKFVDRSFFDVFMNYGNEIMDYDSTQSGKIIELGDGIVQFERGMYHITLTFDDYTTTRATASICCSPF